MLYYMQLLIALYTPWLYLLMPFLLFNSHSLPLSYGLPLSLTYFCVNLYLKLSVQIDTCTIQISGHPEFLLIFLLLLIPRPPVSGTLFKAPEISYAYPCYHILVAFIIMWQSPLLVLTSLSIGIIFFIFATLMPSSVPDRYWVGNIYLLN